MLRSYRLFFTIALYCCFGVCVCAQVSQGSLINDFVEAKMNNQDVTSALLRLSRAYKFQSASEQNALRNTIYDFLCQSQAAGKNRESIALIDLYMHFALSKDKRVPLLHFIKGEISALEFKDSVALKQCINMLRFLEEDLAIRGNMPEMPNLGKNIAQNKTASRFEMLEARKDPNITEYLKILNDYLKTLRNNVSMAKRMEGVWISTNRKQSYHETAEERTVFAPYIIRVINKNGQFQYRLEGTWGDIIERSYQGNIESRMAKNVKELDRSKMYMAWSAEKLKAPSEIKNAFWSGISQGFEDVAQDNKLSFSESLTASAVSGLVSAIVDDILTPSKTMYIIQAQMELLNDYEIISHINCKKVTIVDNEKPTVHETNEEVHFIKWDNDSNILLLDEALRPVDIRTNTIIPKDQSHIQYLDFIKKDRKRNINAYNYRQIMKMLIRNEQEMRQRGIPLNERYHAHNGPALGVKLSSYYWGKGFQQIELSEGLRVSEVYSFLPAQLYDIREDDIILKIDSIDIKELTPQQRSDKYNIVLTDYSPLQEYVRSKAPFARTTLTIQRKKKIFDVTLELNPHMRIYEASEDEKKLWKERRRLKESANNEKQSKKDVAKKAEELIKEYEKDPLYKKILHDAGVDMIL